MVYVSQVPSKVAQNYVELNFVAPPSVSWQTFVEYKQHKVLDRSLNGLQHVVAGSSFYDSDFVAPLTAATAVPRVQDSDEYRSAAGLRLSAGHR
jgi:hypothetical protein